MADHRKPKTPGLGFGIRPNPRFGGMVAEDEETVTLFSSIQQPGIQRIVADLLPADPRQSGPGQVACSGIRWSCLGGLVMVSSLRFGLRRRRRARIGSLRNNTQTEHGR
jgi:hypothetical protein